MLKTKVILSSVTNLSDARYAAGMGVNYVGFSINPADARYLTVEQAKNISTWLSGVSIIGEVGSSPTNEMEAYGLSHFQTDNVSAIDDLREPILTLDINTTNSEQIISIIDKHSAGVDFFILNIEANQLSALHSQLEKLCATHRIFISTEFDTKNLAFVLSNIKPAGIVLFGSNEEKPGLSSYDGIADILEQLEEDC